MPLADYLPWNVAEARKARKAPSVAPMVPANGTPAPGVLANRTGFVQGIPPSGFDENAASSQTGAAQNMSRADFLQELWEVYLKCPWAFACVNVIARTVTAGGLLMKWDGDDGEGDKKQPAKPAQVLAMERLFAFCNPVQDIRQLCRNIVADLQVFGGAMVEVVWFAGIPVALYNQDFPTTIPLADEHGNVTGYKQTTEDGREAPFRPEQIIHITLDSARPSMFGISPTHAAEESIVCWMYLHACEKEGARRGLPPNVHADHPAGTPEKDMERWGQQYVSRNIGPSNVGNPIMTKGGGAVKELQTAKLGDILAAKMGARNEIVSTYGTPPAKVGIIESGNLGGGTGSDQNKSFWLDIIAPIAALIAEKFQFALAVKAFGVKGWHAEFGGVDYRDDQTIENIRDMRLRNGSWTRNRYAADIGEPPVDGGDDAVLVARQDIILYRDLADLSAATVAARGPGLDDTGLGHPGPSPAAGTGRPPSLGGARGTQPPSGTVEAIAEAVAARLRDTGVLEHTAKLTTRQRVYNQLRKNFPPSALEWVLDPEVTWSGPVNVPASQINTDDQDEWNAVINKAKVARIKKHYRRTGRMKPAVLVRAPGASDDLVADGHHHALAMMQLGHPVKAYVAHVSKRKGPWNTLSLRQKRTKAKESVDWRPLTKDEADYAPATSPDVRCGTCSMFSDDRCSLVAGDIDPAYVCSQWQADARATGTAGAA